MERSLIILRGLPGAGKSTLAEILGVIFVLLMIIL
jgi:adenylate kinase family enzyme